MFVLDTNHLREFVHRTSAGLLLRARMEFLDEDFVIPIVVAEEGFRGWPARLAAAKAPAQQKWTRIACITLDYDATLLPRNVVDFSKVPGLRWENWLV